MKRVSADKFVGCKGTVKGSTHPFYLVFVTVLFVILTIFALTLYMQFRKNINMTAVWIAYGASSAVLAAIYLYGKIVQITVRNKVCFAVYEDYLVVYANPKFLIWGYYNIDFSEIKGFTFIPKIMDGAKAPYTPSDLLNYGKLELIIEGGKILKVPIADIASARKLLDEAFALNETPFARCI